jgi:hypothetical protein
VSTVLVATTDDLERALATLPPAPESGYGYTGQPGRNLAAAISAQLTPMAGVFAHPDAESRAYLAVERSAIIAAARRFLEARARDRHADRSRGMTVVSIRQLVDDQAHELARLSRNAAYRNKPTMWAYYDAMATWCRGLLKAENPERLLRHYAHIEPVDLDQAPFYVADRWAKGVYARRILAAAGIRVPRPSLDWLRDRVA